MDMQEVWHNKKCDCIRDGPQNCLRRPLYAGEAPLCAGEAFIGHAGRPMFVPQ